MSAWPSRVWLRPSAVLFGFAAVITVQDHVFEIASVKGPSMSPTLSPIFHETGARDRVLLTKKGVLWDRDRDMKRGQIVGFRPPHNPELVSIKRIIALEGDIVYPKPRQPPSESYPDRKVVIPKGHIWVEGDNWRKTRDSNDYGPISKSLVLAVATHVVWPRWRKLSSDDGFQVRSKVVFGDRTRAPAFPFAGGESTLEGH